MKTSLLFTMALACCSIASIAQNDERDIIINHPGQPGDVVVIRDFNKDTLPSLTRPWRDPLLEVRVGIGIGALNGGQSGGFQPELEASSQLNDLVGVQLNLNGITEQADNHYSPESIHRSKAMFNSWEATGMATFTLGDRNRQKLHGVSWKYYTPLRVRYEQHSQTMTSVRHRHQARAGWNQQGGLLMGYASQIGDAPDQYVSWNDVSVGNLLLGYAWRMDRWLEVQPTERFGGKNLSRSRTIYADLLMNLYHSADGTVYQGDMLGEYTEVEPFNTRQLSFSALGLRVGYRGTYLFNVSGIGIYHRYEMGWRPAYNNNSVGIYSIHEGSKFYLTAAVGLQF